MLPTNLIPAPSRISSCINRLIATPRNATTPSDAPSMDTDYMAANRKEALKEGQASNPTCDVNRPEQGTLDLPTPRDLLENASMMDNYSDDESGNEGDVDTSYTENVSRVLGGIPTREELQREYARYLAERLVQAALLAGARNNITATIVLLPGCGL
jgi:hypothetical protein